METVSSKKHSVFSLVRALGTWQERLSTRPSTYLGGCRKAGLPGASRGLRPKRTGPREANPPPLWRTGGNIPGLASGSGGGRGVHWGRRSPTQAQGPAGQTLSLSLGDRHGGQFSGHNHVTLGKPHPSLSLSLTLQTVGSPQGPLSSEGSEDRTWVLESEHLMPKGLTGTTPPHPETSGTRQPLCLWTSYLKNSPSSCSEHSGQPATVSCGFTLAPAPGPRVEK